MPFEGTQDSIPPSPKKNNNKEELKDGKQKIPQVGEITVSRKMEAKVHLRES